MLRGWRTAGRERGQAFEGDDGQEDGVNWNEHDREERDLRVVDGNGAHHAAGEARAAPERTRGVREAQHDREERVELEKLAVGQGKALGSDLVGKSHLVLGASGDHRRFVSVIV